MNIKDIPSEVVCDGLLCNPRRHPCPECPYRAKIGRPREIGYRGMGSGPRQCDITFENRLRKDGLIELFEYLYKINA